MLSLDNLHFFNRWMKLFLDDWLIAHNNRPWLLNSVLLRHFGKKMFIFFHVFENREAAFKFFQIIYFFFIWFQPHIDFIAR